MEQVRSIEGTEGQGKVERNLGVKGHPCFEEEMEVQRLLKKSHVQRPDRLPALPPC